MLGMCDVRDVGCSGCGMLGIWDVGDVGCWECGMLGMWDVRYVGCSGCGMFRMWDVQDVGCSGCGMWDVGCLLRCGMLIYKMPCNLAPVLKLNLEPSILDYVFDFLQNLR